MVAMNLEFLKGQNLKYHQTSGEFAIFTSSIPQVENKGNTPETQHWLGTEAQTDRAPGEAPLFWLEE